MEAKQYTYYNVVLDSEDTTNLINAIDKLFAVYTAENKIEEIQPLLQLKDAIILAANKG